MRHRYVLAAVLTAISLSISACSRGGGAGNSDAGGDFAVVQTSPADGATIYLNDPIALDFTRVVDLDSASLTTVTMLALDAEGLPTMELVTGSFQLATRPGDESPGRRLLFVPRYPTDNDYQNGGFRAGRRYLVQLVGGGDQNRTSLRDVDGQALARPRTFGFVTREGTQAPELFRNPKAGGPRRSELEVTTATSLDDVPLGLFGAPVLEVRLSFDQALNPTDRNVPVGFDSNPLVRDIAERGRVWLEYQDPEFDDPLDPEDFTWIPADVRIERNDLDGAVVALRPVGVLPNNAEVRVLVEAELEDIAGESNVGSPGFDRVFGTFRTSRGYQQQWNGIAEDFRDQRNIDRGAVFVESLAEVGPGYVRAGFDFEGNSTTLEYRPTANEIVLNTDFTSIVPDNGLPFTVSGGVFRFRNVTITQGVTVIGQGTNPMVWLCNGRFTVDGTLSVRGGDGARVDTLRSANTVKAGGIGACGGGNGGNGSPSGSMRDTNGGERGRGPGQEVGRGGGGGLLSCDSACYVNASPIFFNGSGGGSGGGGGGMATAGDRNWLGAQLAGINPNASSAGSTAFQQVLGYGGAGCSGLSGARSAFLRGGEPGDLVFADTRNDNDFWGSAIDLNRNLRIVGELAAPTGGGGGGGGGDTCSPDGLPWPNDFSGGGGGGGGGVLIVKALEEITISRTGRIIADGGNGGGGEQSGGCGNAGGGGGGAGGMVVLMSAKAIVIEAHGNVAQNRYLYGTPQNAQFGGRDYSFAISADGGVCTTGPFTLIPELNNIPLLVRGKYPDNGMPMTAGTIYDANPLGGAGGMGIVQLMAPPGDNGQDGTNTILDDNIHFRLPGAGGQMASQNVTGLPKQQLLAWRGFPNENGIFVDDDGTPTAIGSDEGDIRPAPILLPVPFQPRSRVRSLWIDTGRSQRRALSAADGLPRGLVGAEPGPLFSFAGTDADGYVGYELVGQNGVRPTYPIEVQASAVTAIDATSNYLGQPAYRVELAEAVLGIADRLVQHEAELLDASLGRLAGLRIVSHTDRALLLDPASGVLPGEVAFVRVRAKFYEVVVNGNEGLGPTYTPLAVGGVAAPAPIPRANVRIGFAFHRDPDPSNILAGRYPDTGQQDFVYDLRDPGLLEWLAGGAPRYVMWDVTFDLAYQPTAAAAPSLSPSTARPELRFLHLPFRF